MVYIQNSSGYLLHAPSSRSAWLIKETQDIPSFFHPDGFVTVPLIMPECLSFSLYFSNYSTIAGCFVHTGRRVQTMAQCEEWMWRRINSPRQPPARFVLLIINRKKPLRTTSPNFISHPTPNHPPNTFCTPFSLSTPPLPSLSLSLNFAPLTKSLPIYYPSLTLSHPTWTHPKTPPNPNPNPPHHFKF